MIAVKDRERLWRAFPEGYLSVRGVYTVGGWVCGGGATRKWWQKCDADIWVREEPDRSQDVDAYEEFARLCGAGDLLPAVDPCDAATWGCVLQELARRMTEFPEDMQGTYNFHVQRWATDFSGNGPWRLCWRSPDSQGEVVVGLVGKGDDVANIVVQNLIRLWKSP